MKRIITAILTVALATSALAATKVAVDVFKTGDQVFVVDEVGNIANGIVGQNVFSNEADAIAFADSIEADVENID